MCAGVLARARLFGSRCAPNASCLHNVRIERTGLFRLLDTCGPDQATVAEVVEVEPRAGHTGARMRTWAMLCLVHTLLIACLRRCCPAYSAAATTAYLSAARPHGELECECAVRARACEPCSALQLRSRSRFSCLL